MYKANVNAQVVAAMAHLANAAGNLVDVMRSTGYAIPGDLFEVFGACCEVGLDHELTAQDAVEILNPQVKHGERTGFLRKAQHTPGGETT